MRRLFQGYGGSQELRRRGRRAAIAGSTVFATVVALNAIAGDELLMSSHASNRVQRYNGESGTFVGLLDSDANSGGAQAAVVGPDGKLYVASEITDSVLRFDLASYAYLDTFVAPGSCGLDGPTGLAFDAGGNLLVASFDTDEVLRFDGRSGAPLGAFVKAGAGGLNGPDRGMTIGPDGHLYVPSFWNHRVLRYDGRTGEYMDAFLPARHPEAPAPEPRLRDGYALRRNAATPEPDRPAGVTGVFVKTSVEGGGLGRPGSQIWDGPAEVRFASPGGMRFSASEDVRIGADRAPCGTRGRCGCGGWCGCASPCGLEFE